MSDFKVTVLKYQGVAVLRSEGYINNLGGEQLAKECYGLLDQGYANFILNLSASKVVNSIGISILIEVIEKVLSIKGRLAFSNLTPTVEKTFKIMGLLLYSEMYPDEAAALVQLNGSDEAGTLN